MRLAHPDGLVPAFQSYDQYLEIITRKRLAYFTIPIPGLFQKFRMPVFRKITGISLSITALTPVVSLTNPPGLSGMKFPQSQVMKMERTAPFLP